MRKGASTIKVRKPPEIVAEIDGVSQLELNTQPLERSDGLRLMTNRIILLIDPRDLAR